MTSHDIAIRTKHDCDALRVEGSRQACLMTHVYFSKIDVGVRVTSTEYYICAVNLDCAKAALRNLIDVFHKSIAAVEWNISVFLAWAAARPARLANRRSFEILNP